MTLSALKAIVKKARSSANWWIAEQTPYHLESLRRFELDIVLSLLSGSGRLLEIGAGAGWQARVLEERGYEVSAVDLLSSTYLESRVWPVTDYDGKKLPFEDNTFDIVFSSNTLEHIQHAREFQKEIVRVLKPHGQVIHVLPSSSWSLWTTVTHVVKYWTPPRAHGEHAGNALAEILYFRRRWWVRLFKEAGWRIVSQHSNRLFYTGNSLLDSRLSIGSRRGVSRFLGASCNIFVLSKNGDNQ